MRDSPICSVVHDRKEKKSPASSSVSVNKDVSLARYDIKSLILLCAVVTAKFHLNAHPPSSALGRGRSVQVAPSTPAKRWWRMCYDVKRGIRYAV